MTESNDQNWKYLLFKKKYPSWIYYIVFGIYAVGLFIWIWLRYLAATT